MSTSEQVPWLDGGEVEVWLSLVGVLIRLPAALDAQLRRDAGVSHFEYQILAALSMAETRTLPMSDMADFTVSSLSRLSHACRRLEGHGWIERFPDPDDGRVTLVTLTKAGYAKIVDAAPGHVRTVRSLVFDPLTKQQVKQLGQALALVQARITSAEAADRADG